LGNYAYWNGDGISTGLLGLAYPGITSEYQGSDPTRDTNSQKNQYDPIFTTMYKSGLSSAMFSMAIQRGTGGYIAFGGLPPVNYTGSFASTPIQVTNVPGYSGDGNYLFYTLTPDAIVYKGAASKNTDAYIVDSGTTLIYAPSSVAKGINNLFSPKATLSQGLYVVDCKATLPSLGIKIGGQTFQINAKDIILQDGGSGQCVSGIQDGGSGPYILGDVFMQSVVVAFDVGGGQLRFAAHLNY
jgi:Eukaryotic aspartyl protease